jgi:hypothetical protein
MLTSKMKRFVFRLLMISALLSMVVFSGVTKANVKVDICCKRCQFELNACYNLCGGDQPCEGACNDQFVACASHCPLCPY